MNSLRRTIFNRLRKILFIVIIVIAGLTYPWMDKDTILKNKISNNFAEQLFNFPLPQKTKVIEEYQTNGESILYGTAGLWDVVASVRFSTKLSKEEILLYYQRARLFKYPNQDKRGVEPEIYFQGEFKKVETLEGYYYALNNGYKGVRPISSYFSKECEKCGIEFTPEISGEEMEYVVQITGAFDYGEKIDEYID